ncbi:MAG: glycosyltransferase [bacterium]
MTPKSKINVLQLVEGLNLGGAETKLLELVAHMDRSRFNTVFCSLGMGERIKEKVDALDVKYVGLQRRRRFDPKLVWDVAKIVRQEKIDVVMTTLFYADVVGALARIISPTKAVFSWETISAPEWLLKHRLLAYKFAMRFCDKVISVSEATAKWLVEKRGVAREKVLVIPYGVNLEVYKQGKNLALKRQLGIAPETFVVGTVARLHPQKGHEYLIEAAKKIVERHANVKFVFVGDGEMRKKLEARIETAGLENNFLLLGFRDDVTDLLRVFDIFVLPSLYEGLPNVILEAMATGLPVVATAVDGSVELVNDGETGFLVPPREPQALIAKINTLIQNPQRVLDFGMQGRNRVESIYSLEKQVEHFQQLYESYAVNGQRNGGTA